ncbi:DUF4113 domain-containing protein [Microbulbifer sp. DLAB2-AA]|uniref:DUF4113 domain-containing protein n=1 Tax=Microbulbifer sp. DLAB2-AA TaxID=3243394 RepID=UPI0040399948
MRRGDRAAGKRNHCGLIASRLPLYESGSRARRNNPPCPESGQWGREGEIIQAMDWINEKFRRGNLFLGAEGIQKKWKMRRQVFTSPAYTTR